MKIDLLRATSVHYRTINPTCFYCTQPAEILRATIANDGGVYVATMCPAHAREEIESECSGMHNPPGTSDFYRRPGVV